jgi:flagellar biosynthesis/type III secretory pathway chaperone
MTTSAVSTQQSPLEATLLDVQATLADLLVAADEQHAAVAERDHDRLETVTRQQERLSSRLARAEAKRLELLNGEPLPSALAKLAGDEATRTMALSDSIRTAVKQLQERHARTANLLQMSIDLAEQSLVFMQRLLAEPTPAYGARGRRAPQQSLMVDGRA